MVVTLTLNLSCNKTTSQEICAWDICKEYFPVSQVIMMPLEIIPYLTEEVMYMTTLYYTSVVKCNGGVACTHVYICTQMHSDK